MSYIAYDALVNGFRGPTLIKGARGTSMIYLLKYGFEVLQDF